MIGVDLKDPQKEKNQLMNPRLQVEKMSFRPLVFMKEIDSEGITDLTLKLSLKSKIFYSGLNSNLKMGSYAFDIQNLGCLNDMAEKTNEILYLDEKKRIVDSSFSSLVFIGAEGGIILSKIYDGVLDGVTRRDLVDFLKQNNFEFKIKEVFYRDLNDLSGIYLINGVKGCLKVKNIILEDDTVKTFHGKNEVIESFKNYLFQNMVSVEDL